MIEELRKARRGDKEDDDDRFKQLQEALKGDLSNKLVSIINYEKLQERIIEIVNHTLSKELVYEDKIIVENALNLWVGCLQQEPTLFKKFADSNNSTEFVMRGILHNEHETIREQFKVMLGNLCKSNLTTICLEFALNLLNNNLGVLTGHNCDQYIGLFCISLENLSNRIAANSTPELKKMLDSDALLSSVINRISEENVRAEEIRTQAKQQNMPNADELLGESSRFITGLMFLTGKILEAFDNQKEDQTV